MSDIGSTEGGGQLLNMFLLNEPNRLTITLRPAKGAAMPPAGAFAIVNVNAFGRERASKPELVYHYEWRQTSPPKLLPATIHAVLPPVVRSEPLSWQNAPKTPLTQADKAEIKAQIKRLHDALASKNLAEVKSLLASKTENFALALSMTAPERKTRPRKE